MKFIAHRGYSSAYPENSLPAFEAVVNHPQNGRSLAGIELDIHLTADGRIPVMHETTLPDENGRSVPVASHTFIGLQRNFKRFHGEGSPAIPAIEEVLELVKHRTELCFEVKTGSYDVKRFAAVFASALKNYVPRDDVTVSSFSFQILDYLRPFLGGLDLRYGYIFKSADALMLPAAAINRFDYLHPWYRLLFDSPETFAGHGIPVRCWTVNDPATVQSLTALSCRLPIAAVMTDDIALAETAADG